MKTVSFFYLSSVTLSDMPISFALLNIISIFTAFCTYPYSERLSLSRKHIPMLVHESISKNTIELNPLKLLKHQKQGDLTLFTLGAFLDRTF